MKCEYKSTQLSKGLLQPFLSKHNSYCIFSFVFVDCESLVRKMLVRDPTRRCSLTSVRKHPWMRVEVPQEVLEMENVNDQQKSKNVERNQGTGGFVSNNLSETIPSKGQQPLNEQVLRVMQSLGIDPTRTTEVIL